jgi:hypothetical protein
MVKMFIKSSGGGSPYDVRRQTGTVDNTKPQQCSDQVGRKSRRVLQQIPPNSVDGAVVRWRRDVPGASMTHRNTAVANFDHLASAASTSGCAKRSMPNAKTSPGRDFTSLKRN